MAENITQIEKRASLQLKITFSVVKYQLLWLVISSLNIGYTKASFRIKRPVKKETISYLAHLQHQVNTSKNIPSSFKQFLYLSSLTGCAEVLEAEQAAAEVGQVELGIPFTDGRQLVVPRLYRSPGRPLEASPKTVSKLVKLSISIKYKEHVIHLKCNRENIFRYRLYRVFMDRVLMGLLSVGVQVRRSDFNWVICTIVKN